MHLIELIFRIAPDDGSGITELAILLVCAVACTASFLARRLLNPGKNTNHDTNVMTAGKRSL